MVFIFLAYFTLYNGLWYIYTMEYYSAIKKNSFESVLMRWMKVEPIKIFSVHFFHVFFSSPSIRSRSSIKSLQCLLDLYHFCPLLCPSLGEMFP